jgi:putative membrane protein
MKRKTQKLLSLVLAAALLCGAALPAAAASSGAASDTAPVTKDENVYVVLNADGSIQSQTVSAHLHSDAGLASVQDKTDLTDVKNTQSSAECAQTGDTLTWDTQDTDVYYKGTSTATPPITAGITYQLDGRAVSPADLAGKSGHLAVTIALQNTTGRQQTVNGAQRTVVTPFVAVVGAVLGESFSNVTAEHGTVQADGGNAIVGFACLPGVKGCLSDLLPDSLGKLDDYLLDTVTFEADVTDYAQPQILIASAADASLLGESDLTGDLDLDDLQSDMDALTDAMDQLTSGASDLNDGAADLQSGAGTLKNGTASLATGTGTLKSGADKLNSGAADLQSGAGTLNSGAASLKSGAADLKSGADSLNSGAAGLKSGLDSLKSGLDTAVANNATLNAGAQQIADAVLATVNSQLKANGLITEDLTWASYASVLGTQMGVSDEVRAQAKQTIADAAGLSVSDPNLNGLIYLAALDTQNHDFTAAGAKMQQAAKDAAATGAIGKAQAALAGAGGDPTQLAEVQAVLESAVYDTIVSDLTAQGAAAADAPLILTYAAQNYNTAADLTANLQSAAAALGAAQWAATAQQTLAAAGSDPSKTAVMRGYLVANGLAPADSEQSITDAEYQAAYGTLAGQLGMDPAQSSTALVLTMALLKAYDSAAGSFGTPDWTSAGTAAAAAQSVSAGVAAAQTALGSAGGAALKVPAVKALADTQTSSAYSTIASQITQTSDAGVKALLITMAAQAMAGDTTLSLSGALISAGSTLTAANEVQSAVAKANDASDTDAQNLITAFLNAQSQSTVDAAVKTANDTLVSVAAFVQGLQSYTAGVAAADAGAGQLADGAGRLQSGAASLADGAGKLAAGTVTLADGTQSLVSGVNTLKSGTQSLASGAGELQSGANKLDSGAGELADGTKTLKDGTQTLLDGVDKLNAEGIEKLTDSLDTDQLKTLVEELKALKDRQQSYTSFSGAPAGVTSSVKFVCKTAETVQRQQSAATSESSASTTTKTTFWQRFLNLFKKK